MLAGPLDDTPGFDTPRERFRQFLAERITHVQLARPLVERWQHSTGEQHHRALQDALVMFGRFLGFETTFGSYQPIAGAVRYDGHWRVRRRVHVVLEIRTEQTPGADLDSLTRSLAALAATSLDPAARTLGLCVMSPRYAGRARIEQAFEGEKPNPDLRIVSAQALLALGDMVAWGVVTPDDVVNVLISASNLDVVIDLLERLRTEKNSEAQPTVSSSTVPADADVTHWLAMIVDDGVTPPARLLESLIGKRNILGVNDAVNGNGNGYRPPRPDDWICIFVPGLGVAGHGQVASLAEGDGHLVRGSDRVSRVLRLKNVELYNVPIRPVVEKERRLVATLGAGEAPGPVLAPISSYEFAELTRSDATGRASRSPASLPQIE